MSAIAWIRQPFARTGKARYVMTDDGKPTGYSVEWCGHPTALRPYYIVGPRADLAPRGAYRSSVEARADAEAIFLDQLG